MGGCECGRVCSCRSVTEDMRVSFAKSLDRPVDVFGIKGKWLSIFLWLTGGSVFLAIVVGSLTTSGLGIGMAFLLVFASFFVCLVAEGKVTHRQVGKFSAAGKGFYNVRRHESIASVLLADPRYDEVVRRRKQSDAVGKKDIQNQ